MLHMKNFAQLWWRHPMMNLQREIRRESISIFMPKTAKLIARHKSPNYNVWMAYSKEPTRMTIGEGNYFINVSTQRLTPVTNQNVSSCVVSGGGEWVCKEHPQLCLGEAIESRKRRGKSLVTTFILVISICVPHLGWEFDLFHNDFIRHRSVPTMAESRRPKRLWNDSIRRKVNHLQEARCLRR